MNLLRFPAGILLLLVLAVSCKKNTDPENLLQLTLNKTVIDFPAQGGLDSFVVQSNSSWKISSLTGTNWLQASRDSGVAGNTVVYLYAQPNPVNSPRTATLAIASTENTQVSASLTVNQLHDLKITGFSNYQARGGETLEIFGRGFSTTASANTVTINGMSAPVLSANNTYITVTVPLMAGSGPVIVSSANKADTSDTDFIYQWTGVVTIIAGGTDGYLDGNGTAARFWHPEGIEFDAINNIYIADYANSKVRKITPSYNVSTMPGRFAPWNNPGGPLSDYGLPTNTGFDANGNMYVVEYNSNGITRVSPSGTVTLFAGGNQAGLINGVGTAASFNHPVDIAIDPSGNMYITDKENYCIRKITPAAVVTTFAGGPGGYQDGTGTGARFNRPMGIAFDAGLNLYVTDFYNNRIRKVTSAGVVTTFAGTGMHGSQDGNVLTEATFTNPHAIAIAPNGIIYVTESDGDNMIRRINTNGKVETISGFTNASSGLPFQFNGIYGLAIDNNGILHATDYYNNRICKITYR